MASEGIQVGFSDTIYALASGAVPAGIAVVRISGPGVQVALEVLCGRVPEPRQVSYGSIRSRNGELLDVGLCLFFAKPNSFTGEDVAELHLHGGRAVVDAIHRALAEFAGLRHAEPGEFTLRAFRNGKLDLPQVEALADLINAETEAQRRLALAASQHDAYTDYARWQHTLTELRASIEAELDFADEADVADSHASATAKALMGRLRNEMDVRLRSYSAQEIVRHGFKVALVGAPNVGKSSLLNALAGRDVAIVTPVAGTTRDLVEFSLDLHGRKVVLVDTAGLRETSDIVETIGIARARDAAASADLVLHLDDGSGAAAPEVPPGPDIVRLRSKADLQSAPVGLLGISARDGTGLDDLLDLISSKAAAAGAADTLPIQARHRDLLVRAVAALDRGAASDDPVLVAEELREASNCLGSIVGRVGVEEVLGQIFSRFCIGK
jgi:tRNA modification GTPase